LILFGLGKKDGWRKEEKRRGDGGGVEALVDLATGSLTSLQQRSSRSRASGCVESWMMMARRMLPPLKRWSRGGRERGGEGRRRLPSLSSFSKPIEKSFLTRVIDLYEEIRGRKEGKKDRRVNGGEESEPGLEAGEKGKSNRQVSLAKEELTSLPTTSFPSFKTSFLSRCEYLHYEALV